MIRFIMLFVFLNSNSCECEFSEKKTYVKWEKSKNEFVNTNVDIGTLDYSLNLESCEKKNKNLIISSSIYSPKLQKNNDKSTFFCLLGINQEQKSIDTLYVFNSLENNFTIEFKKYDYFVFKEKNSLIGTKYFIKDFN